VTVVVGGATAAVPAAKAAAAPAAGGKKPAAKDEDDEDDDDDDKGDLFGDDDEEDDHLAKLAAKKAAEDAAAKKPKKKIIEKTLVTYEVKPLEAGQDMKQLEEYVRAIKMDGLVWAENFKVEDVAFGIQKLVVQCVVEDEKVELADLEEALAANEDLVSSVDQTTMQKAT
jgi:elongation factor 1-beta